MSEQHDQAMRPPFRIQPVGERSLFERVRNTPRPDLALAAVETLVAGRGLTALTTRDIRDVLSTFGIPDTDSPGLLTMIWEKALREFVDDDGEITSGEEAYLSALQRVLDLGEDSIAVARERIVHARFVKAVETLLANDSLRAEARAEAGRAGARLRIPKDIQRQLLIGPAQAGLLALVSPVLRAGRVTHERWYAIVQFAERFGIALGEDHNRQLLRCLELSRLDAGELPGHIVPTVQLDPGETCLVVSFGFWHETRRARARGSSFDQLQLLDSGLVHVTTKRVLFTGQSKTTTIKYNTILDIQDDGAYLIVRRGSGRSPHLKFLDHFEREVIARTVDAVRRGDRRPSATAASVELAEPGVQDSAKKISREKERDSESLDGVLGELEGLVGLAQVKAEVVSLANVLRMQRLRAEQGLPQIPMTLHMVFTGNPGTGKTTVARLLSRIYRAMGVLPEGQLVETDRGGLVGGYLGQTAIKTQEVIQRALGGVLFIDEAYALTSSGGTGPDQYGQEAVATFLKAMEDFRDQLVVIVAGYTGPMTTFLESNPGLRSRFTRFLDFPDYSPEEMVEIFARLAQSTYHTLSPAARTGALAIFTAAHAGRGETFGNARVVRTVFERACVRLANRLATDPNITRAELTTIEAEDIVAA